MKRDIALAFAIEIVSLVLALLVPLVVLFRQRTAIRTTKITIYAADDVDELIVDRQRLPDWLWWWQTPDELLPGGLYERTVRNWYIVWGEYYCCVRWLLRNRLYGLAWRFGRPADGYLDPVPGQIVRRGALWRGWWRLGPLVAQAGWKVHRRDFDAHAERGPLWAIPFVSIRLARNS